LTLQLNIGAPGDELRDDSFATMKRRPVQRCVALRSPFVHISTAIDEAGDMLGVVRPARIE
jgi:hypothetical protein